eukprot:8058581-Lingulodinium_polyedra.AAC.1
MRLFHLHCGERDLLQQGHCLLQQVPGVAQLHELLEFPAEAVQLTLIHLQLSKLLQVAGHMSLCQAPGQFPKD